MDFLWTKKNDDAIERFWERLLKAVALEISRAERHWQNPREKESQFPWKRIEFSFDYTDTVMTIYRDEVTFDPVHIGALSSESFRKLMSFCREVVEKCLDSASAHEWPKRETKGKNFVTIIGCQFFLMDEDDNLEWFGHEYAGAEGFEAAVVLDRFHPMIGANYGEVYPFNTEDEAKEFLRKVEEEEEEED